MGLFDFLKPKSKDILDDPSLTPSMRKVMLAMELEYTTKEAANLMEVGREGEANDQKIRFLLKCLQESHRNSDQPSGMRLFANAAMKLGLLELGEKSLIAVTEAWDRNRVIDLTLILTDLGRIYHQMGDRPEKELAAYTLAIKCDAPRNCKYPASPADKAKAHNFAFLCARRTNQHDQALHHDEMPRKLIPDLDWDDRMAVIEWIQSE